MADDKLRILIEAVDNASKTLRGVQGELARLDNNVKQVDSSVRTMSDQFVGRFLKMVAVAPLLAGALKSLREGIADTGIEEAGNSFTKFGAAFVNFLVNVKDPRYGTSLSDAGKALSGFLDVAADFYAPDVAARMEATAKSAEKVKAAVTPAAESVDRWARLNDLMREAESTTQTLEEALREVGVQTLPQLNEEIARLDNLAAAVRQARDAGVSSVAEANQALAQIAEMVQALREAGGEGGALELLTVGPTDEALDKWKQFNTLVGQDMKTALAGAGAELGATFVDAAFGAKVAWGEFFKDLMRQLAAAIVRALIFRAIMTAIGGGGGAAAGAAGATVASSTFAGEGAAPVADAATVEAMAASGTGIVAVSNSFLGVSREFVEALTTAQNDLARRYGVQVLATGEA